MTKIKNRFLIACLLILVGIASWHGYKFVAYDFSRDNVSYPLLNDKQSHLKLSANEISQLQEILHQPFTYLDQGTQSYVFVSRDQRYVLKFFKFRHLKPSLIDQWVSYSPFLSHYLRTHTESQHRKLERLFFGYKLAYEKDKENNGIVFLHLNKTEHEFLKKPLVVQDRYGFKYLINLDETAFILQEKGEATKKVISKLLNKGDVECAKKRFRQILDLYVLEYKKGIWDRDHNVMYNTGFINGKPVRLDVGRLRADDRFCSADFFRKDLEKIAFKRIDRWLRVHYPKYREEINADVKQKVEEIVKDEKNQNDLKK